jgi:hypothetical protein
MGPPGDQATLCPPRKALLDATQTLGINTTGTWLHGRPTRTHQVAVAA